MSDIHLGTNVSSLVSGGGSGAAGRVAFWTSASAISSDADFGWDSTSNLLRVGGSFTQVSAVHIDKGKATASDLRFTAGTTTGQTASDGFQIGITATGLAEIRQREALAIDVYTSNSLRWSFAAATPDLIYQGDALIKSATSDASDNRSLNICGGGDALASRGAFIFLAGNEQGNPGIMNFRSGTSATGNAINFYTNNTLRWSFDASTADIVFNASCKIRAGTADAADSRTLSICAGGGGSRYDGSRGAVITLEGNEASAAGCMTLYSGTTATGAGAIGIITGSGSGEIKFTQNTTDRFTIRTDGFIQWNNPNTGTTVGAAGAASALPANPTGYLREYIGGTLYKIPYYADA